MGLTILPSAELPALGLQLQVAELTLMERFYCFLCWKDGVEIVAVPLQTSVVKVAGALHRDEVFVQEDTDGIYHGVPGHPRGGSDGAVAGVASVRFAILDQQQISVYHKCRGRKVQQENFIGKSEKLPAIGRGKFSGEGAFFCDQPCVSQDRQALSHSTF